MKQVKQTLIERADERQTADNATGRAGAASMAVNVGVVISALLTIIYLMLLVNDAIALPSPWGYIFGVLVGVVAIIPAELSMMIWRERLASDQAITDGQRSTAVIAMVMAGIFSALTTSSFFSYFLPQLFPASYMAIAPVLNVGAIVGSWIVFILAIVSYGIFSRQTRQNLSQAKAMQSVFNARMSVLTGAAEAIRTEADDLIAQMDNDGVFATDARALISTALGMGDDRMKTAVLPTPAMATVETAVSPPTIGYNTPTQKTGEVIHRVTMDANGNIISSVPMPDLYAPVDGGDTANFTNQQEGE